ncbi:hypothetical protein COO60DRAFT_463757 [Scenedesmus sp. NREL 46B-D3]|nr:hypothetical protein COO60DRAFT_463757 [Scenedesmus sp. NREL 46B-D3]
MEQVLWLTAVCALYSVMICVQSLMIAASAPFVGVLCPAALLLPGFLLLWERRLAIKQAAEAAATEAASCFGWKCMGCIGTTGLRDVLQLLCVQ